MTVDRTPEEILQIRRQLVEIEFRCKSSDDFLETLRADPESVLRDFGLDEYTTNEVLPQLTGELRASEACASCDGPTCWVTGCCYYTTEPPVTLPTA
jgi:hypothetical protein